ncbi:hypothetical protein SAMN05192574_109122 [Mucilaginibacter gossypiicola]|uniref:Uncharacterized protein n=1 Tax=Mucilaginibacter gossypiicola TaxID=551995 RepID=A0A1H8QS25_9SPHI|nr:hypothetical protein [Mucilaginibacter gossypiicola]SEO56965.1 hypothetical protein SAMN05192574_109122 [Mucilaginibacter gossypiicola]
MENNETQSNKNSLAIVLMVIGCILIAGNIYFFINRQQHNSIQKQQLDSLAKQLDTASAKFEIGYGEMSIASYNKMKAETEQMDGNPLVYPVMKNEIDNLITTNTYHPDYGLPSTYLQDFTTLYKQNKLKLSGRSVACLIVKQAGKGKAQSVKLDINHLKLDEVSEMYDPTDINKFENPENAGKPPHKTQMQLDLGVMDTGSAWLIPLYISEGFRRVTGDGDPSMWFVTGGPILVPVSLSYINKDKTSKEIPLRNVLDRPIEILD